MTDENLTPASEEAQGEAQADPQTDPADAGASTADMPAGADGTPAVDAAASDSVSTDSSVDPTDAPANDTSEAAEGVSDAPAEESTPTDTPPWEPGVPETTQPAESASSPEDAAAATAPSGNESAEVKFPVVGPYDQEEPVPASGMAAPAASAAPPAAPKATAAPAAEAPATMDQESDHYSRTFTSLNEGDVIQGVVVHIDREGVLVDVGTKSEGIIRRNELSRDTSIPAEELVQVGQTIDVYVMEAENQDGNLILSKKRADFEKAWEKVQEAKEENRTILAMVTDRVKGGLVVDLGIRGFVPASHVGNGSMKNNLERYVGQSIPLKVIEVDKDRRKVVLSNKMAQEEERASKKQETVSSLQVGQTRKGVVRRLTNYGAFVDLGGIDGLLHISEMSWTRINHPQEVLKEGQELDVLILKMDLEAGRVSLGLRQILPDPWTAIDQHFRVGDVITGQVSRVVPFGIFVQVEGGIEGIIPNSELAARKGGKNAPMPAQGEDVEVKVVDLRPEERKMTLSLRGLRGDEEPQAQTQPERRERRERRDSDDYETRMPDREEPRFTIGDALRAKEEAAEEAADEENDEDAGYAADENAGDEAPEITSEQITAEAPEQITAEAPEEMAAEAPAESAEESPATEGGESDKGESSEE
jgi:predicted RNA-binding protein with RPS1 domain